MLSSVITYNHHQRRLRVLHMAGLFWIAGATIIYGKESFQALWMDFSGDKLGWMGQAPPPSHDRLSSHPIGNSHRPMYILYCGSETVPGEAAGDDDVPRGGWGGNFLNWFQLSLIGKWLATGFQQLEHIFQNDSSSPPPEEQQQQHHLRFDTHRLTVPCVSSRSHRNIPSCNVVVDM